MNVEEIPSNELVVMTNFWHRAFNAAGCDPMCHNCKSMIQVGNRFKLATIETSDSYVAGDSLELKVAVLKGEVVPSKKVVKEYFDFEIRTEFKSHDTKGLNRLVDKFKTHTKEVMLCDKCTPEDYKKLQIEILEGRIIERDKPKGGCFRINGKIIH